MLQVGHDMLGSHSPCRRSNRKKVLLHYCRPLFGFYFNCISCRFKFNSHLVFGVGVGYICFLLYPQPLSLAIRNRQYDVRVSFITALDEHSLSFTDDDDDDDDLDDDDDDDGDDDDDDDDDDD